MIVLSCGVFVSIYQARRVIANVFSGVILACVSWSPLRAQEPMISKGGVPLGSWTTRLASAPGTPLQDGILSVSLSGAQWYSLEQKTSVKGTITKPFFGLPSIRWEQAPWTGAPLRWDVEPGEGRSLRIVIGGASYMAPWRMSIRG